MIPTDSIYRIADLELFLAPDDYAKTRIPTKYTDEEFVKTVGYVTGDDVNPAVANKDGILEFDINEINESVIFG